MMSLHRQFIQQPFVTLATVGGVILDDYEHPHDCDLLTPMEANDHNNELFNKMLLSAPIHPSGGQHGAKAQALDTRDGIVTNVFDLHGLDEAVKVKMVNMLVTEHSDVQNATKEKSYMDTMVVTRAYIKTILGFETAEELYKALKDMEKDNPEEADAERLQILEKLNHGWAGKSGTTISPA
jgi:hypothetical protein